MKNFSIKDKQNKTVLYSGSYKSFKQCLEIAVSKNINLNNADLSNQNLHCANIDGANLSSACFKNSNLNDANISECNAENANFTNATLIGTCMAESNFSHANFTDTTFGANILSQSILDKTKFNTLSALNLPLQECLSHIDASFITAENNQYNLSKPPIVISGIFKSPIFILQNEILIGHKNATKELRGALSAYLTLHTHSKTQFLKKLARNIN